MKGKSRRFHKKQRDVGAIWPKDRPQYHSPEKILKFVGQRWEHSPDDFGCPLNNNNPYSIYQESGDCLWENLGLTFCESLIRAAPGAVVSLALVVLAVDRKTRRIRETIQNS